MSTEDVREALAAIVKQVSQKFGGPSLAEFANDPPTRKHYATADAILAAFPALSSPPADDVREATRSDIADEISGIQVGTGYQSTNIGIDAALEAADAILAVFEVRPYGTVTDAEVEGLRAIRDKVKQYADDRYYHARTRLNTLSSWRVWSDLYQILGLSPKEDRPS